MSVYKKSRIEAAIWIIFIFVIQSYGPAFSGINKYTDFLKRVEINYNSLGQNVSSIYIAGTFNDWSSNRDELADKNGDGIYSKVLFLPKGKYLYKFIVDGNWVTDEHAMSFEPDGKGGRNSVIIVTDKFNNAVSIKGDSKIFAADIPVALNYSIVDPMGEGNYKFKAISFINDVDKVELILKTEEGKTERTILMSIKGSGTIYDYYNVKLYIDKFPVYFVYKLTDGSKIVYQTPEGFIESKPSLNLMYCLKKNGVEPFKSPEWAKNGIIYQIFTDRFNNGNFNNDQDFKEFYYDGARSLPESGKTNGEYFHFVHDWYNVKGLSKSPYRTDSKPDYYSFYGGDIKGVMEKLDYLYNLGITIIYFNPLNEARSNHKYDPVNYKRIDPHFADERVFKEFVKKAHSIGIRIIVDMAYNHTGNYNRQFLDTVKKGPASRYWNWFEWKKWPLPKTGAPTPCTYYDCWWGYPIHPTLNYDLSRPNEKENDIVNVNDAIPNQAVVHYVLSSVKYWLDFGIDGFRLDVPNEVPFWMWEKFTTAVKRKKPDALLIGEIWGNALQWIGPKYFHSTMNYKYFRDPVLAFFIKQTIDAVRFDKELAPGRYIYPEQSVYSMMNLCGSHDTERVLTMAGGNIKRVMLSALFEAAYVGIPHIYYGDEVALEGGKDPDNRRTFPWNWKRNINRRNLHEFYKRVIRIRRKYSALRTGEYRTVIADGNLFAFERKDDKNTIYIIFNNGDKESALQINAESFNPPEKSILFDELNDKRYFYQSKPVKIVLPALSGAVLVVE